MEENKKVKIRAELLGRLWAAAIGCDNFGFAYEEEEEGWVTLRMGAVYLTHIGLSATGWASDIRCSLAKSEDGKETELWLSIKGNLCNVDGNPCVCASHDTIAKIIAHFANRFFGVDTDEEVKVEDFDASTGEVATIFVKESLVMSCSNNAALDKVGVEFDIYKGNDSALALEISENWDFYGRQATCELEDELYDFTRRYGVLHNHFNQ
ncbi:MAG: hypothetical protein ACI3Y0_04850 [Prevotella sp.]